MKKILFVLIMLVGINLNAQYFMNETKQQLDARMEWWRDARFGLFIHWGLYSIPAGEWKGVTSYGEWILEEAKIPVKEYEKFLDRFNPIYFNADEWVKSAKYAGMKYIVITSKHHDGFCLFDSEYTDFDVMSTPFRRDILKELADACRKYDVKICWYYSIMDWNNPDYLPRRSWDKDRPADGADYKKYLDYMKNQLTELVTNYGDIGILWFDGEWEETWKHEYGVELYNYLRSLQPSLIINNRIDGSREGMAGMSANPDAVGDYGTPEQEIPEKGLPGVDWESCMTMNDHWGYNKFDNNWKSAKVLLRNLTDIASKGGNYLLNVGPTSDGLFPRESIDRLNALGDWIKINGESIYGTDASPFKSLKWGRCTRKEIDDKTKLYLHVFDWPADGKLIINNLLSETECAYLLSDPKKNPLKITRNDLYLSIELPLSAPDSINSVVVLEIKGRPVVIEEPEFNAEADGENFIISLNSKNESDDFKIYYTTDGSDPVKESNEFNSPIIIKYPSVFKAVSHYNGKQFGEPTEIRIPLSVGKSVLLKNSPNEKYNAGGAGSLTDFKTGSKSFMDGKWLGFEKEDFEAVIDLGVTGPITNITLSYLVETRSWIFAPKEICFEISEDGQTYSPAGNIEIDPVNWNIESGIYKYSKNLNPVNARYVKFLVRNFGNCPDGHSGKGGKAWFFVDEIFVY